MRLWGVDGGERGAGRDHFQRIHGEGFLIESVIIDNLCFQDPLSDYESDFSPKLSFAKTTGWKKSE